MKVRTSVIVACMTVVPGLALFSHRLPADFRASVRSHLWEPVETWAMSLANGGAVAPREARVAETPIAEHASLTSPESVTPSAVSPVAIPAAAAPPISRSSLASLGAVAIDCRPLDGLAETHVASCRIAVDASGQLHRVFQSAGRTPDEAMASLEEAVRAWQSRRVNVGRAASAANQF